MFAKNNNNKIIKTLKNKILLVLMIKSCLVGIKVSLLNWSPPKRHKWKMNSNASISNNQMFVGFILFDYCGVHHFRSVKLYQVSNV